MADFLHDSRLSATLEEMIRRADDYIWLISPYVKLHDRIKKELGKLKEYPHIQLVIIFGKNENDASKSLSTDDLTFLKELPNILIGYEKNLHAKFYATEEGSLITSMNLHQYSQNTNIEVGIYLKRQGMLNKVASTLITDKIDTGEEANKFFQSNIIDTCQKVFEKVPQYDSAFLGINKKYNGSKIEIDITDDFFTKQSANYVRQKDQIRSSIKNTTANNSVIPYNKKSSLQFSQSQKGYCIRTGVEIDFNPERPFSYEAFQSWAKYKKDEYPEKYCHLTGRPSNGKTSKRSPILK